MSNMANHSINGDSQTNGVSSKASRFDPKFTDAVNNAIGRDAHPRLAKIMTSLTTHLHDWMRENEITLDDYMAGIDMVSRYLLRAFRPNRRPLD